MLNVFFYGNKYVNTIMLTLLERVNCSFQLFKKSRFKGKMRFRNNNRITFIWRRRIVITCTKGRAYIIKKSSATRRDE